MSKAFGLLILCGAILPAAAPRAAADGALEAGAMKGAELLANTKEAKAYWARHSVRPVPPPPVERLEMPGLTNAARVEKQIYRGSRPHLDKGGMASLRKLGIKTVINLQGGDAASGLSEIPGMTAVILKSEPGEAPALIKKETVEAANVGIVDTDVALDSLDPITPEEAVLIDKILRTIAAAEQPIYVHCEHGKDRTGLIFALYRVRYDGWSVEKAAAEMKEMGHTGFLDKLFTGNMDVGRVLKRFPGLATPAPAPLQ